MPVVPVTVHGSIVDNAGAGVFDYIRAIEVAQFMPNRMADVTVTVPLARLRPPGDFLMTVEAATGAGAVHRQARFSVREK